jgi:hypothetical protein
LSEEDAIGKVRTIQATNTLEKYIKKYGMSEGKRRYEERKINWIKQINTPEVSRRKSLGLWRYIERYG